MNSELWLQLSIWVLIVSQYDIYINDTVLHALSPPIPHFVIQTVFVMSLQKTAQFSAIFHSNSTNVDQIAQWTIQGERASKTASFTYISYCDMIRTQILSWSASSELAKLWNWPQNRGFGAVPFFDVVNPLQQFQFRSDPDLEPNHGFGTVANTTIK